MKWFLWGISLVLLSPAYGQTNTKDTSPKENGVPTREERLEMLRERQAKKQTSERRKNAQGATSLGSSPDTLTREESQRNQEARNALRAEARRDKRLRRVRGPKKRLKASSKNRTEACIPINGEQQGFKLPLNFARMVTRRHSLRESRN